MTIIIWSFKPLRETLRQARVDKGLEHRLADMDISVAYAMSILIKNIF